MKNSKGIGRDFFSIFGDYATQEQEQTTQEITEERIRKQLKSLKDERNTHTQRIRAIDSEIGKLEADLSVVAEQNRLNRKKALEEESISLEKRLEEIRDELNNMEDGVTATA